MNVSELDIDSTATTRLSCAEQRALYVSQQGYKNIVELCVGPSLPTLEREYAKYGITVTGNDIEKRYEREYPTGNWIIGDALELDLSPFDLAIFAPPLSIGCTGRREDSLSIEDVTPSYYSFLEKNAELKKDLILTLPGRSLSNKQDSKQYYKLLVHCFHLGYSVKSNHLYDERGRVRKYIDLHLKPF